MTIDLDTYCVCRVALAIAMLKEPGDPKFRKAFNALRQSLVEENERASAQDAMPQSMFHRKQAG
jgi:hypothetical protein